MFRAGGEKAARQNGGVVSVVVVVAVGVNSEGRREVLVRAIGLQRADTRRDSHWVCQSQSGYRGRGDRTASLPIADFPVQNSSRP
jgi:hypothetical protein